MFCVLTVTVDLFLIRLTKNLGDMAGFSKIEDFNWRWLSFSTIYKWGGTLGWKSLLLPSLKNLASKFFLSALLSLHVFFFLLYQLEEEKAEDEGGRDASWALTMQEPSWCVTLVVVINIFVTLDVGIGYAIKGGKESDRKWCLLIIVIFMIFYILFIPIFVTFNSARVVLFVIFADKKSRAI